MCILYKFSSSYRQLHPFQSRLVLGPEKQLEVCNETHRFSNHSPAEPSTYDYCSAVFVCLVQWPAFYRRLKGNIVSFGLPARLLAYPQRSPLSPLQSVRLAKEERELEQQNQFFRNLRDLTKLTEVSEFEKRAIVRFVFPLFGLGRGKEKRENQYLRKLAKVAV